MANPSGTEAANKAVVQAFFDRFNAGDTGGAFALVDDSASWWVPGDLPFSGTKTKAQYLQVVGAIRAGFPSGFRLDVESMIAEGDRVAAEVESTGRHVRGRDYRNRYHFLFRVRDGLLVEVKEYMDTLHLHQLVQP